MLQRLIAPLGTFAFGSQPIQVNLIRGVNIHEIILRVSAAVTFTDPGGGAAGTALAEGVQRLLRSIRLRHDGTDRMILDGRWGYRLMRATGLDYPIATNIASGAAQVATSIEAYISIPFERAWNARPFDTVWSGRTPVVQELALYLEWETAAANAVAGTVAGTGALVLSDNTMSITFPTAPSVEVTQIYSTNAVQPAFVPHYVVRATDAYTVANAALEFPLLGLPRFDSVFVRQFYGAANIPQDGINNFTFQVAGGATKFYNNVPWPLLQMLERRGWPGVFNNTDSRLGEAILQFPDKGRLSSLVVPASMNDPRFVFDVDAPTATSGRVHMLYSELHKLPGVTKDNL